eukprot:scaffold237_cov233-Pinguiococcus_pyrenoidosus.AAC.6
MGRGRGPAAHESNVIEEALGLQLLELPQRGIHLKHRVLVVKYHPIRWMLLRVQHRGYACFGLLKDVPRSPRVEVIQDIPQRFRGTGNICTPGNKACAHDSGQQDLVRALRGGEAAAGSCAI